MINLNQSIIDKIDNFSPPQASPKEEPIIQPQWMQSQTDMLRDKIESRSRANK